jgi:uncharacterized protein YjbI with pentapeptide repeats
MADAIDAYDAHFDATSPWGDLRGARFEACTFKNVNWAEKNLRQARFEDCTFEDCDWSNARVLGVGLQGVQMKGCKLVGVRFEMCNPLGLELRLESCNCESASFLGMDLRGVKWKGGKAHQADFTEANAEGVCFDEVALDNAVFDRTNLSEADFRTATGWRIDPTRNRLNAARFDSDALTGLLEQWKLRYD